MKNDGSKSQDLFVEMMEARYGKDIYLYRLADTREIKGLIKAGFIKKTPSDYVITLRGSMFYGEVKSTTDPKKYSFKFEKGQTIAMVRQRAARGNYMIYVHSLHHDQWYVLPSTFIMDNIKKSATWEELQCYALT